MEPIQKKAKAKKKPKDEDAEKRKKKKRRRRSVTYKQDPPRNERGMTVGETFAAVERRATMQSALDPFAEHDFGRFSQQEAGYKQPADDNMCGTCRFYLRNPGSEHGGCEVVGGPIAWFGTSDLYISAEAEAAAVAEQTTEKQDDISFLFEDEQLIVQTSEDSASIIGNGINALRSISVKSFADGVLINAPSGQVAWAPKAEGVPTWAQGAQLMFLNGQMFDPEGPGVLDTRKAAMEMGAEQIVFVNLGETTLKAIEQGEEFPNVRWAKDGDKFRIGKPVVPARKLVEELLEGLAEMVAHRKIEKKIREVGGKFCVFDSTGEKNLGCHETRDEAVAQLRAIEANKAEGIRMLELRKALEAGEDIGDAELSEVIKFVPPRIPEGARVVFVAGAPSATEAARGELFVGHNGRTFNEHYLKGLGLTRDEVGMMYSVPEQVSKDDLEAATEKWRDWYEHQLAKAGNPLVVFVGTLGKEYVSKYDTFIPHPKSFRFRRNHEHFHRKMKQIQYGLLTRDEHQPTIDIDSDEPKTGHRVVKTDNVSIIKQDEEDQVVFGVVLTPYVIDTQNDWVPPADIEKAAERFIAESRIIGLQHQEVLAEARPVQSVVWPYPEGEKSKAHAGEPHRAYSHKFGEGVVRSGEWLMAIKIEDPTIWAAVKSGELGSYSIGGFGVRVPIAQSEIPQVDFIDVE